MKKTGPGSRKRIALFGYFGAWNLGDESVVAVLIAEIRRRWPDAIIQAICLNPELTQRQHGIAAIPLRRLPTQQESETAEGTTNLGPVRRFFRRVLILSAQEFLFLIRSYRRLRGFEMVIVAGSGQVIDNEGGPLNHPFNHLKWTCLARLAGARFLFVSVGAGPMETRLGKWLTRRSLSMASYRSFRDDSSRQFVENLGVKGQNFVYPDQAFCIDNAPYIQGSARAEGPHVVGVAPIAYADPRHWPDGDQELYNIYLNRITAFIIELARSGHRVLLFHTQLEGDDRTICDVREIIRRNHGSSLDEFIAEHPIRWYPDALNAISKSDVVVASRFHAILFSMIVRRPVLAISYAHKIDDMMNAAGQGGHCVSIGSFTPEQLTAAVADLVSHTQNIRNQLDATVTAHRQRLKEQYDRIFS